MAREFKEPAVVILKHANPCGVGRGGTLAEAYAHAVKCDPVSAFGGIIGVNRPLDGAAAEAMKELFLEVIIAPDFTPEARAALAPKKNLRLLEVGPMQSRRPELLYKSVHGGLLVQEADVADVPRDMMTVMTQVKPTPEDWEGLLFAWRVVRWVKSNAIVYANRHGTVGIGAGQMSRIDAARFGRLKAEASEHGGVKGAYLASDAFFPFRDVVDLAAEAGVRALIQPGGSVRDDESIRAADEHGLAMVFTGRRHFRH
jgi:phosphoribosylaminoimidazolecarboxamide formyltransferase/IMP cyclohydrolase